MNALPILDRITAACVLILPLLLLHAHGVAEAAIAIACLCFLARSALTRDWAWATSRWMAIAWVWWAWDIVCSLPVPALHLGEGGTRPLIQALVFGRFFVLIAAMESRVLRPAQTRRWFQWIIAACAAYIAVHTLFQWVTGVNLYGWAAGQDGELTGPFGKPRAGPPMAHIILPAVLPWAAARLTRPGPGPLAQAVLIMIGGVAVVLLIGQRMPFVLTCLGLATIGLLLPRLRWGVAAAALAVAALLAATPLIAPQAHYRLVSKFTDQLAHFSVSHYGKLYARALEIGIRNPVTGLGAEGYRTGCTDPTYFRPTFDGSLPDGGGASICWVHPHNYYLEALVTGGFPGLILFASLSIAWLATLGHGLWRRPDPLRAALFAATLIMVWPIASSTSFVAMPVAGWCFLMLGWGLAEARWPRGDANPI